MVLSSDRSAVVIKDVATVYVIRETKIGRFTPIHKRSLEFLWCHRTTQFKSVRLEIPFVERVKHLRAENLMNV